MISAKWQRYLTRYLKKFNGLPLLNFARHMGWKYHLKALPHLHFTGTDIAGIDFGNNKLTLKHYDLNMLGFNSLLPVNFAVAYWQEEREANPSFYALLLKAAEQHYYENFLKAALYYRASFNREMFDKAACAMVGGMHENGPLKFLLIRYSAYLAKKSISLPNLTLLLTGYLKAPVQVVAKTYAYQPLLQTERSALGSRYNQVSRGLLLGLGVYQIKQHLIIQAELSEGEYKKLLQKKEARALLVALIKRLVNKTVTIELQVGLDKKLRKPCRLGASLLGRFSWFGGQPVFNSLYTIKEPS